MRKILSIIMIFVLSFAMVFIYPAKQANANPLAVGGALYLGGAGVYVLGAVGVAAIAGIAGCESCQEDIEAHAARTWDGTTQLAKDGLQLMIDSSVGLGNALTATDANFNNWMDSELENFIAGTADIVNYSNLGYQTSITPTNTTYRYAVSSAWSSCAYGNSVNTCWASVDTMQSGYAAHKIVNGVMSSTIATKINMNLDSNRAYGTTVGGSYSVTLTPEKWATVRAMLHTGMTVVELTRAISYATGNMIMYSAIGATTYNSVSGNAREAWEDMRDAGLVLPVDNARPMYNNEPVTYDPTTDSYAGIDGIAVPRDGITFDFQKPNWKTLDDLAALGLAGLGAGLYIDGWAGSESVTSTYNPATDTTSTTTSGTTTNVTTGETAVTSTTTTTTGDTTGNPPVDSPPVTPPKTGEPLNPFKAKPMPIAALTGLFQLLAALIFYLIRMFTFIATIALIAPTPIDNPYFLWFTTATFQGITPYPLVQNLALFFLGFSVYKSVRRVFG